MLLVVNPGARGRPEGRILKAMLAATAIAIGIYEGDEREGNGWDVLKGVVGSVVRVQGWLSSGSSSFREEG